MLVVELAPTTLLQAKLALKDLYEGFRSYELWSTLGWQDIRQRYRRSMLGPWWLTLSTAIMVGALGLVYHSIFKISLQEYLPFLASGLIVWMLISTIVQDACQAFVGNEQIIKQIKLPFTLHACRSVWRNLLIFCHHLLIAVVTVLIFRISIGFASLLWIIAGLTVILVNAIWVTLLLGAISTRFRDIPPIAASFMQLFFFLTPVIWHPSSLVGDKKVIVFNPFYHFVEIFRAPLLGNPVTETTWLAVLITTLVGWSVTLLFFIRYRRRIAYWL